MSLLTPDTDIGPDVCHRTGKWNLGLSRVPVNETVQKIRERRRFLGMNQPQYAEFLGIPCVVLRYLEHERWLKNRLPTISGEIAAAVAIADDIEVPMSSVMRRQDPSSPVPLAPEEDTGVLGLMIRQERSEALYDALTEMGKKGEILNLRFGLVCEKFSLREVARIYNVTRERIRQLEAVALSQLRWPKAPSSWHKVILELEEELGCQRGRVRLTRWGWPVRKG